MPFKRAAAKCGASVKRVCPESKRPINAPARIKFTGAKNDDTLMGVYHKLRDSYQDCPVYVTKDNPFGKYYCYKKGKRWRIGTALGSDECIFACTDASWWPSDITKASADARGEMRGMWQQ